MPRNDVLDDEARLRRRLSSLATAMDLAPDVEGRATDPRFAGAPRPRRGVALVAAAAAIVLLVVAAATLRAPNDDGLVEVSATGSPASSPPSVRAPAPATGADVSDLPVDLPTPSRTFSLASSGAWPGPDNADAPRSSPEDAVRSYVAATLGEPAAAASTFTRWPVIDVAGAVTFSATLPSGVTITVQASPEPSGQWMANSFGIGETGTAPTAVAGEAPNTATELSVPVVAGAEQGRLWYEKGGATWEMELGPDVMQVIEPPMPDLPGHEPSVRILIPADMKEIHGIVLVYLDGHGTPISLHSWLR